MATPKLADSKGKISLIKAGLHPRNKHKHGYNFKALVAAHPLLARFIIQNKFNGNDSIDFSQADAVKALNCALLKYHYKIEHWDIPTGYLCPPIPGRVDYIHYLADLLKSSADKTFFDKKSIDKKATINVLDIGTGASCIYPILGQREYQWHFVATDIDPVSIAAAQENLLRNKGLGTDLDRDIECRLQTEPTYIFKGIIRKNEFYHLTLCNPPFHKSLADATAGTNRKVKNLAKSNQTNNVKANKKTQEKSPTLNFGGQKAELWCDGGELAFIRRMINESKQYAQQVLWFTCLVSKKDNLSAIKLSLKKANVSEVKVTNMAQGQKISRFVAWRF